MNDWRSSTLLFCIIAWRYISQDVAATVPWVANSAPRHKLSTYQNTYGSLCMNLTVLDEVLVVAILEPVVIPRLCPHVIHICIIYYWQSSLLAANTEIIEKLTKQVMALSPRQYWCHFQEIKFTKNCLHSQMGLGKSWTFNKEVSILTTKPLQWKKKSGSQDWELSKCHAFNCVICQ